MNLNLEQYQFLASAEGHRPFLGSLKSKTSPFLSLNLYPVTYLRKEAVSPHVLLWGTTISSLGSVKHKLSTIN